MLSFIDIRFVDIIDILLVSYMLFAIYKLIKGTIALNILLSIFAFVVFWLLVRALKMNLISSILDNFVNIGLLALIIIFQQEIRRFFLMVAMLYDVVRRFGLDSIFNNTDSKTKCVSYIVDSCKSMSKTKTGALIVLTRSSELIDFQNTGDIINAEYSSQLIETIFFKNTPLHDGAMIVNKNKILAAACILPVSQSIRVPKSFGLRHRSALGITEATDAAAIVVSEETGNITFFDHGEAEHNISIDRLAEILETFY